jgi:ribosomal-protein-alanine N-acetyltransferase
MSILEPQPWSTARLTLRPVRLEDVAAVHSYASNPEVTKYLVFPTHRSASDAEEFLLRAIERNSVPGASRTFLIERSADGIGMGVFDLRPMGARVEIGYVLDQRFWGQGYMTEALHEAITLLLAHPQIYRVESNHDVENPASGRVMQKAGMTREGVMRRHTVLVNLSAEPRDMILYAVVR